MLSAGHPSVLKSFAARQVEHSTASTFERRMLQEQVVTAQETAQVQGVAIDAAAPHSDEQLALKRELELARIASVERLALEKYRMRLQAQRDLIMDKERAKVSAETKVVLQRLKDEKDIKLSSDNACLAQFNLERQREEGKKADNVISQLRFRNRLLEGRLEDLEDRLNKKDAKLDAKDEQLIAKDEKIAKLQERLETRKRKRE